MSKWDYNSGCISKQNEIIDIERLSINKSGGASSGLECNKNNEIWTVLDN